VVVGQLSQSVEQCFESIDNYDANVKVPCNLAGLFKTLDEVVLGDCKD